MISLVLLGSALAAPPALDPAALSKALGVEAKAMPDGAVKATWPRTDVAVTVEGVPLSPPQGLSTWASFTPARGGGAMVMGDTVLFQDEIDAAIDAAFANGLEVTALHNHFFHDEPRVFFMHLGGAGDPATLARGVRAVWDAVKAVRAAAPAPQDAVTTTPPAAGALDADGLSKILGQPVKTESGVVRVVVARKGTMDGAQLGDSMGLTSWAAFAGSDARAVVDGDFIMTADQVQPTLRALRRGGIHVVALHNHMIGEEPAYYFTHFWGDAPAADLARTIRAALDASR